MFKHRRSGLRKCRSEHCYGTCSSHPAASIAPNTSRLNTTKDWTVCSFWVWYSVRQNLTGISRSSTNGFFSVIGIAAARVPTLRNVEAVHDPTYSNAGVFYWTCAETAVAHLCAAAPAIRPLYVKLRDIVRRKRRKTSESSESDAFSGGSVSNRCKRSIPGLSC